MNIKWKVNVPKIIYNVNEANKNWKKFLFNDKILF